MMLRVVFICLMSLQVAAAAREEISREKVDMPNVPVQDQNGKALHFYDDLIKNKTVAMNFIFTSCPTVCPPMGANFGALQRKLKERNMQDIHLISVSIDPVTDTPERLMAWRSKFGGGPGWDLVTGKKQDITKLLKMLNVFATDINTHSPFVVMGNASGWRYLNGLTPPEELADMLADLPSAKRKAVNAHPAAHYFPDTALTDQNGVKHRFYSDLVKGKIIVVNTFFTSCTSVCPRTMDTLAQVQARLGERMGKQVHILSISVDPITDTPNRLADYASKIKARPGWFLLTGTSFEVNEVLKKLGQFAETPEGHSNIFIIGNEPTGLWKKALGLAPAETVIPIVESVVEDHG